MNFAYGVIAFVGVLVAISLGFIAMDPQSVPQSVAINPAVDPAVDVPVLPATLHISILLDSGLPGCEVDDACYSDSNPTVTAGTTVSWSNDDNIAHTVTSGNFDVGITDIFDSSLFPPGESFEYTFDDPGTFEYFCIVHPWMVGTVNVE